MSTYDISSSRLLLTVTCTEVKQQSDQCIWDNQRISNDDTASEISINHEKNY
jgi:hypothetical protein